jgi:hypothetical protein
MVLVVGTGVEISKLLRGIAEYTGVQTGVAL